MAHDREFQRKRKDTRMPVRDSHGEDQPAVRQTEQDFDLRRARDTPSSVTGNTGVLAGAGRSVCNLFGWLFRSL